MKVWVVLKVDQIKGYNDTIRVCTTEPLAIAWVNWHRRQKRRGRGIDFGWESFDLLTHGPKVTETEKEDLG